jgi:hypothetical protein
MPQRVSGTGGVVRSLHGVEGRRKRACGFGKAKEAAERSRCPRSRLPPPAGAGKRDSLICLYVMLLHCHEDQGCSSSHCHGSFEASTGIPADGTSHSPKLQKILGLLSLVEIPVQEFS